MTNPSTPNRPHSTAMKVTASAMGILACFLWFAPIRYVNFMNVDMYQTGMHIGGWAWLIILCAFAYACLAWTPLHAARILVAGTSIVSCLLLLLLVGESFAWGLVGLTITSFVCTGLAIADHFRAK